MLIQFKFKNHKSFLNETVLSLKADSIKELPNNKITYKNGKEDCLKTALVCGANASGKSNLVDAFKLMKFWITRSFQEEDEMIQKSYKFSKEGASQPSLFEVFFVSAGREYQYGFSFDEKEICEEWLYQRKKRGPSFELIYEREKNAFDLSEPLKKYTELLKSIKPKTLVLSVLSSLDILVIAPVIQWFENATVINFGNTRLEDFISRKVRPFDFNDEKEKQAFISYLKAFDFDICDIREDRDKKEIYTAHVCSETGENAEIPLGDESSGTLKMIALYRFFRNALKEGSTLFIDEMDAKLHVLLVRYILNQFHNENTNPNNAQLIFTSHDSNLLDRTLLRRDQVWLIDKTLEAGSNAYALSDYKVDNKKIRNDASYEKDYLGGRYGAIPNLKDFWGGK